MALAIWRKLWSPTPKKNTSMNTDTASDECPPYSTITNKCDQCSWCLTLIKFDHIGVDEADREIMELIKNIWFASFKQQLTPCVLEAVRACIEACKKTEPTTQLLTKYFYKMGSMSLAIFIILHSLSDNTSEADVRSRLLRLILDELPMTQAIRDRLYLACAKTGSNLLFGHVRQANCASEASPLLTSPHINKHLKSKFGIFEVVEAEHTKDVNGFQVKRFLPDMLQRPRLVHYLTTRYINNDLKSRFGIFEVVETEPTRDGFQVQWFLPDMLQRSRSGCSIYTEVVAQDQIWGLDLNLRNGHLEFKIYGLKPSPVNGQLSADITLCSDLEPQRLGSNCERVTAYPRHIRSTEDVYEIDRNNMIASWGYSKKQTNRFIRPINKDGSCYLKIHVKVDFDRYTKSNPY